MSDANSNDFEIYEDAPDHHFRTEIPNIIIDSPLERDTIFVYTVLKRITGDTGKCWMSKENLAKRCKMGETKLREALNHLSRFDGFMCDDIYIQLEKPLIEIIERKRKDGGNDTDIIKINSVWKVNGDFYRMKRKEKVQAEGGGSPDGGGGVRQTRGGGSPDEPKEEHLAKKIPKKKNQSSDIPISSSSSTNPARVYDEPGGADEPAGGDKIIDLEEMKEELEPIHFRSAQGADLQISQTEIYRHFCSYHFSTETLKEAIRRTKTATGAITNILKYIESVCGQIEAQNEKKAQHKKEDIEKKESLPQNSPKKQFNSWAEEKASYTMSWNECMEKIKKKE